MPRITTTRAGVTAAMATMALLVGACGGSDSAAKDAPTSSKKSSGTGDYAFGTDRDQMGEAIERAFATQDGKVRWDGDLLILSVDGDADEAMAGFTECRVLASLLKEDDQTAIKFPNGQVDCSTLLGGK